MGRSFGEFKIPAKLTEVSALDTITFCGEVLSINPVVDGFLALEFAGLVSDGAEEANSTRTVTLVHDMLKAALYGDGYARMRKLSAEHNVGIETLLKVAMALFEATTGNPTEGASDSSVGSEQTGLGSMLGGSSGQQELSQTAPFSQALDTGSVGSQLPFF